MPKPTHAGQRAIQALTLGVAKSRQKARAYEAEAGFAETEQQFQFPISGHGGPTAAFATKEITFDYPFYYAPGQRDSDLEKPQMRSGFVSPNDIMVTIGVQSWTVNEDTGGIIGCVLNVGVLAAVNVTFAGVAHAEFQGFSAPDDHADDDIS